MGHMPFWLYFAATSALLVLLICCFIYYSILTFRVARFGRWQTQRLRHVLNKGEVHLFIYYVVTDKFTVLGNDGEPVENYSPEEMASQFPTGQFDILANAIRLIVTKNKKTIKTSLITNSDSSRMSESGKSEIMLSVLHWKDGKPTEIACSAIDVTADFLRKRKSKEHLLRSPALRRLRQKAVVPHQHCQPGHPLFQLLQLYRRLSRQLRQPPLYPRRRGGHGGGDGAAAAGGLPGGR